MIGERWSRLQAPVPHARQFTYNSYGARERVSAQLSARERYHEAMRQLQPLCSEIAEISDNDEFEKAIQFVQEAWMNARMRKRVKVDAGQRDEAVETSDAEPPTQPSAGVSLTQNSLYSDELGEVRIMDTSSIALPRPVADDSNDDDDFEEPAPKRPLDFNIKLNPHATRPGRPKSDRAKDEAVVRQSRQAFNDIMTARRGVGEVTMKQLLDSLDEEKPGLAELKRRLDAISVRHVEHGRGRVEFVKKPRSTTVRDAFYTLPRALLDKCFKALPLSNDADDAISLFSQSYSQEGDDPSTVVDAVKIGTSRQTLFYSRTTIEVMQRVNLLKDAADEGLAMVRWLERDVASSVPSAQQQEVRDLAEQVSTRYPTGTIDGFTSDYHYAMLPRVKPPAWFNDGFILAFCERLSQASPSFKATRVLQFEDPDKKRLRSSPISPYKFTNEVEVEVQAYEDDESVQLYCVPISFENQHWCCMIVEKERRVITTYDSLGGNKTQTVMGILSEKIEAMVPSAEFTVQRVQTPVQTDGYSCGFFVCYKVWRHVDTTVSRDLSRTGQLSLRFQMLKLILQGPSPPNDTA